MKTGTNRNRASPSVIIFKFSCLFIHLVGFAEQSRKYSIAFLYEKLHEVLIVSVLRRVAVLIRIRYYK